MWTRYLKTVAFYTSREPKNLSNFHRSVCKCYPIRNYQVSAFKFSSCDGSYFLKYKQIKDRPDGHVEKDKFSQVDMVNECKTEESGITTPYNNFSISSRLQDDYVAPSYESTKLPPNDQDKQSMNAEPSEVEKDEFISTQNLTENHQQKLVESKIEIREDEISNFDMFEKPSALSSNLNEDIDLIGPNLPNSFNLAAYVNKSSILQELLKLGIDLHKIERNKDAEITSAILKLDFKNDVEPKIKFLQDIKISSENISVLVSKNPHILTESLENLNIRIKYLKSKNFTEDQVTTIIVKAPLWITMNTKEVDKRLGIIQKMFSLSGNEIRSVVSHHPKLVTFHPKKVQLITFSMLEEMGFSEVEMKEMLFKKPRIWTSNVFSLKEIFDFLHNTMKISHQHLVEFPEVLRTRKFRLKNRHLFLNSIGRAQYDPEKPRYVSLKSLISSSDGEFSLNVAKKSVHEFKEFVKSI